MSGAQRRAALIEVAIDMFSDRPYAQISIEELAEAAGVAKGLLYYYFTDKRGLYVSALETLAEELREQLAVAAAQETEDPLERLRHGLDLHLSFIERYTAGYRELMASVGLYPELRGPFEEGQKVIVEMIVSNIPPEVPRGPAVDLAVAAWGGFVDRAELAWLADPKADREQVLDLCVRTLVGAVLAAIEVDKIETSQPPRGPSPAKNNAPKKRSPPKKKSPGSAKH